MDNLLAGKTRKEASRMFFETLVCSLLRTLSRVSISLYACPIMCPVSLKVSCLDVLKFIILQVLKTRDYIHVEQAKPFDNISIQPRIKLMKSDFWTYIGKCRQIQVENALSAQFGKCLVFIIFSTLDFFFFSKSGPFILNFLMGRG